MGLAFAPEKMMLLVVLELVGHRTQPERAILQKRLHRHPAVLQLTTIIIVVIIMIFSSLHICNMDFRPSFYLSACLPYAFLNYPIKVLFSRVLLCTPRMMAFGGDLRCRSRGCETISDTFIQEKSLPESFVT